jgi:hypothetical protein
MTTSSAQLRANKKWNEANYDKFLNIVYEWRKIPENKQKQAAYMKKYQQRRNAFLQEFRRLANILL